MRGPSICLLAGLCLAAYRPARAAETPYAVDAALGFCASKRVYALPPGVDPVDVNVARMAEAGVAWARDRLSWAACEPRPGTYAFGRFAENVRKQNARGIRVLMTYHDAPRGAACEGKVPSDLRAVYDFARAAAASVPAAAWEFWNEENITAHLPVWNYAAAFKAAALGFRAGRPGVRVLPGSPTHALADDYTERLFANGLAAYADVMNFHDYGPLATYRENGAAYRRKLAACGAPDMAYWLTECGFDQEGAAETPGPLPGIFEHAPAQEAWMAEYLAKSQLLRAQEGAARTFFFMFGVCSERQGRKAWGLLRRDGSPKPGCRALAELTGAVGRARPAGELDVGDKARALLYVQEDGTQSVAYWARSPLDTERHLLPREYTDVPPCAITLQTAQGPLALTARREVRYRHGLRGLVASRPPVPPGRMRRLPPPADLDETVVARVTPVDGSYEVSGRFTKADFPHARTRIRVELWNFAPDAKRGTLASEHFDLHGLPDVLSLPAAGQIAFEVEATPKPGTPDETFFDVRGTFAGKRITPLVMPVALTGRFLATCEEQPVRWRDTSRWKVNSNAIEKRLTYDPAEQALRFDYVFPPNLWSGKKWAYPEYALALPAESCTRGRFVAFEIKCAQDKAENDFMCNYLMVVGPKGRYQNLPYLPPSGAWESRRVPITGTTAGARPEALMPGETFTALRIGGNPEGRLLTFWIRNIRILRSLR